MKIELGSTGAVLGNLSRFSDEKGDWFAGRVVKGSRRIRKGTPLLVHEMDVRGSSGQMWTEAWSRDEYYD